VLVEKSEILSGFGPFLLAYFPGSYLSAGPEWSMGCYEMSFRGVHRLSGALELSLRMVRFLGFWRREPFSVRNFNGIQWRFLIINDSTYKMV
jgi:hypothetical protein